MRLPETRVMLAERCKEIVKSIPAGTDGADPRRRERSAYLLHIKHPPVSHGGCFCSGFILTICDSGIWPCQYARQPGGRLPASSAGNVRLARSPPVLGPGARRSEVPPVPASGNPRRPLQG